jgi:hypothetical protein
MLPEIKRELDFYLSKSSFHCGSDVDLLTALGMRVMIFSFALTFILFSHSNIVRFL